MKRPLPWPLPAVLIWATAWSVFGLTYHALPRWGALLLACAVGVAVSVRGINWSQRCLMAVGFPLSWLVLVASQMPAWDWWIPLVVLSLVYPLKVCCERLACPALVGALQSLAPHIELPESAKLLDAGCGAGHGLQALHQAWPTAQVHGVEWRWPLRWLSQLRCPWAHVHYGDMWAVDWSQYNMVYLFHSPATMRLATVKAMGEMREGAWLVSIGLPIAEVCPRYVVQHDDGSMVYAYQAPLAGVDHDSVQADEVAGFFMPAAQGLVVQGQRLYPVKGRPGGSPKYR